MFGSSLPFDRICRIGGRKRANGLALAQVAQDLLVVQRVDFGPAFLPALAGAGFHYDGHTSWSTPVAERCAEVKFRGFDPSQPLWEAYVVRRAEMLKHWSWETYLPGHTNNIGPLDIVAALIGTENLRMQMSDDPEGVKALSLEVADFVAEIMRDEVATLRAKGPADGTTDVFRIWMPGNGTRFVEDVTVLIGPEQTREFVLPASRRATQGFDSVLYHTHSAAWKNLPIMTEMGGRLAVEFGTDPGNPDLDTRIAAVRALQECGLPVQYGSWNHPLSDAEIQRVVDRLDPRGLILRFQADSVEHSNRLYEKLSTMYQERKYQ